MNDLPDNDEIIDPLTSAIIVFPCVVPLDNDAKMTIVCDINMLNTYLWSKPENPFTRHELSIEELLTFNKTDTSISKVKEVTDKLRIAIKSCND